MKLLSQVSRVCIAAGKKNSYTREHSQETARERSEGSAWHLTSTPSIETDLNITTHSIEVTASYSW